MYKRRVPGKAEPAQVLEAPIEEYKPAEAMPAQSPMDKFLTSSLAQGKSIKQILDMLTANGWHYEHAYRSVADFLVRKAIDEGYSFANISEFMVKSGWDREVVTEVLTEIAK